MDLDFKALRGRTYGHMSIWLAAGLVGLVAVGYARMIAAVQAFYFEIFKSSPILLCLLSPLLFILAVALVVKIAPKAKGSGIPQVLEAIEVARNRGNALEESLVSVKTALVKVISSLVGILGGASIGREGPTVQLASSGFAFVGRILKKRGMTVDPQSFLIAGAASGVAAAFNTPIAGIAFAIEELAEHAFGSFKQTVMLSVIVAGIGAQGILGNYLYFGHPDLGQPTLWALPQALLIGLVAGVFGGGFARLLAFPKIAKLPAHWVSRALICGLVCAAISWFTSGDTAGSGYEVSKKFLDAGEGGHGALVFPILKLVTTVLSYLSGMAGGIFSPSLSIGAGIGMGMAEIFNLVNFKACALMGMVGFFSGTIQAPLTGTIIVMEMTDQHLFILPFMVAAFSGHWVGKKMMPEPLYRYLANASATPSNSTKSV